MGSTISKDSRQRRISFDNNFTVSPIVPKCIDDDDILELDNFTKDADKDLLIKQENTISYESQDSNDGDYWIRRIDNLRKEHQSINKIIETEYEKTVQSANKIYDTSAYIQDRVKQVKPCFDWRAKILKCYEDNPHQPLLCSAIVQGFSQCVKSCRIED